MDFYQFLNLSIWLLVAIYVLAVFLEWLAIKKHQNVISKKVVLSVRVARENEVGPLGAEQIFSTLHSVVNKITYLEKINGKSQDIVSFEIANVGNSIKFFVCVPEHLKTLIEGQIFAQYPNVEIETVNDYAEIKPEQAVYAQGVELGLTKFDFLPIKSSSTFEEKATKTNLDPLSGITATLAKLSSLEDQAWIQVVVSPIPESQKDWIEKCFAASQQKIKFISKFYYNYFFKGTSLVRTILFPVTWILLPRNKFGAEVEKGDKLKKGEEKTSKLLFDTTIRIAYLPKLKNDASTVVKLREIAGSFKQFNHDANGFKIAKKLSGSEVVDFFKLRKHENTFMLSNEELATIYHLPNISVQTPNIYWVRSKKLEPPNDLPVQIDANDNEVTLIGKTNFRGGQQIFGIKSIDRARHMYIIGKTGMGKSTLLENMIYSDIMAGRGVAVIDPHGDLAEKVIDFVPARRTNDVVIFDPSDRDHPIAFNLLENVDSSLNSIISSGLVGIFKKIYAESWGPRLEHILRNTILSLLEYPDTTMLGIVRILQDSDYRKKVIRKLEDPLLRSFWMNEFEKFDSKTRTEAISPILNKVGQFLSSPIIRNILGQVKSKIDFRFAMDNKKIVIINLSKGKIGEDNSSLLGAMLITKFQIDAMSRANLAEKDRKDFYLYVDEFQNFATDAFATILSEARKYKLNLTMANQYIAQMPEEVKDAVFGNVGTILSYQVGVDDAEYLSIQYSEEVLPSDLTNLPKYNAYMKLLNDGMPSKTFSLATLPPVAFEFEEGRRDKVIRMARERYTVSRTIVEDKINRWSRGLDLDEPGGLKGENDKKEATAVLDKSEQLKESSVKKVEPEKNTHAEVPVKTDKKD